MLFSAALLGWAALASAGPAIFPRNVTALDVAATEEAQQRDETATRAFSNVQIKTSDGRCLFVDKLSGDFRENLTPIQIAACGTTDGQSWDVITAGKHIDEANSMLLVSTLTNACFNFDPRRAVGNQVLLFSCGGRADGGGSVTPSQIFSFNNTAGPLPLQPTNAIGSCLTAKGNVVDVANCNAADNNQSFSFGGSANTSAAVSDSSTTKATVSNVADVATSTSCRPPKTFTAMVTVTASSAASSESTPAVALAAAAGLSLSATSSAIASSRSGDTGSVTAIDIPTAAVSVSRGGLFQPTAAAEANVRDASATRAFSNVEIRAPNGQCLFADPTAGDFRENLVPVALVDCSGTPNEKWDVITAGVHNNVQNSALIVSSLTNGCISFDGRRAINDTVTLFSCGGRADGSGQTDTDQLMPFIGAVSFSFAPMSQQGNVCILPGNGRLVSGACPTNGGSLFSIFP